MRPYGGGCTKDIGFEHVWLDKNDCIEWYYSMFVAPATTPTTLYRFEKNVTQSSRTFFSASVKTLQSATASSSLVDVLPRAREASLPAKTIGQVSAGLDALSEPVYTVI